MYIAKGQTEFSQSAFRTQSSPADQVLWKHQVGSKKLGRDKAVQGSYSNQHVR
jgi:hypothetical protein